MNTDRKKVLYLITKSNWGGAQRYVFDLATHLPSESFEAVVALGGDGPLKEKLNRAGIRTININSLQRDISVIKELASIVELFKILRRERPDVFHVNSSKAGGTGSFIGRMTGVPSVVFTAHGWAFNEDRPKWQKVIIKFLHWITVLLSHQTIAVSNAIKTQMNWPFVKKKMTVVHNGRKDTGFLDKEMARQKIVGLVPGFNPAKDDVLTATIGELHPVKRHDVMIEAIKNLASQGHRVRHFIIGDGELRGELEKYVENKGLNEHVFFLGHVENAASYLKAFDTYTQPSRSEAFAYTVIEAAQAGLPIVASRVGGIPEIIVDGENGTLVPTGDTGALTNALLDLLTNPSKMNEFAMAAKKSGDQFNITTMLDKTIAVYSPSTIINSDC